MPLLLVIFVAMVFLVTVILAAVGTPWETFLGCAITAAGLPERVNTFSSYINYKYFLAMIINSLQNIFYLRC